MKRLFSVAYNDKLVSLWLVVVRMGVGMLMLTHGFPKFVRLLEGNLNFGDPIGLGSTPSFLLVVFSEVFCSLLLILGLGTRLATIPLIISSFVAAFVAHADDPFGKKEMLILYILVYFTLLVMGSGKYSLDALINPKKRRR